MNYQKPRAGQAFSSEISKHNQQQKIEDSAQRMSDVREKVQEHVFGQNHVIDHTLAAFLAGGHVLYQGHRGLGKSLTANVMGPAANLITKRFQCLEDTMASDFTGSMIMREDESGRRKLVFNKGPVFDCNIFLADELSRSTAKAQSGLLQPMADHKVSMDGKDHFLKIPFFTIATQNPDIYAGTKPVDEALSDRFMICEPLEELDRESRKKVQRLEDEELVIKPILRNEEENDGEHELLTIQKLAKTIAVPEKIEDLILDVTEGAKPFDAKNPPHPDKQTAHPLIQEHFRIGAYGERANQTLRRLSRAKALMQGRTSVEPGDVKEMIVPLLFHRMVPLPKLRGMSDDRKVDVLKMYADECIPGHS